MVDTSAILQHNAHITDYKSLSLSKQYWRIFYGDSKVKSNDSSQIPDRGETSGILSLLSGGHIWKNDPECK